MIKEYDNNNAIETEINQLGSEIVTIRINRNKHKKNNNNNINNIKDIKEKNINNDLESNINDIEKNNNICEKNINNDNNNDNDINNDNNNDNNNKNDNNTNNNKNTDDNNELKNKEVEINNNLINEKKEEFNLDNFNKFLQNNVNIQDSSNHSKQIKSHLKPHLKLKLNIGLSSKKKESPKVIENKNEEIKKNLLQENSLDINNNIENNNLNNNININNLNEEKDMNNNNNNQNNNDNFDENININYINESENLKKNLDLNSKIKEIKDQNIESSFILKKKFDKINESQISYELSSSINQMKEHKIKKKFKLSLYKLQKLALLGAGASGEVYLVQDIETKKKLALKEVKYTDEEKTKNQIETEVKLGSLLKHENIIRIYATYFLKGRINFVMEYMDKGTISDILKKVKKIPEKFVGLITYQVLKGMTFCQKEKRIIHRDLKPSNILVNSKGLIKIADFGVSTIVENSWAQKKTMIGTYIYMAPERIDADLYYINCDVWSLGIIVMECILGFYPYIIYNNNNLPNSVWIVHELIENNPVPKLDNKIHSQELIDFANKCLIKDPKERPTPEMLMSHPFIQKYNKLSYDKLANWLRNIN